MKRPFRFLALALALPLAVSASAQAQTKQIFIANDDHTDYMWATDAETYANVFVDLLDFHLKLTDDTIRNAPEFQDRFNADGSYWLWNYERKKSPAEFNRLMARIKDGHISAPLNTLVSTYGAQPAEATLRGLYYAGRLERRYGVRFEIASATENQTLPLGLASLFAGAGARYSWRGVCGCASQIPNKVLADRPHEIYWYEGQDGQRLLMKWHSLGPNFAGTYSEASYPEAAIKWAESDAHFTSHYVDPKTKKPYDTIGIFGFGGDAIARKTAVPGGYPKLPTDPGVPGIYGYTDVDHFHKIAQKNTTPTRKVIVSNETDFFKGFEARYGATLPTESVTYGNEWDLYPASMSETTARVKRAVEKLRAAEMLATLVARKRPEFLQGREAARDEAFTALGLYYEHDWTADGPISRPRRAAWQEKVAGDIEYYVNSLYADGVARLGGIIGRPARENRFFVLNPLGHTRTDFADFSYNGATDIHVRDLVTSQDVPHQLIKIDGIPMLRILASEVPAAGFKTYEILPGGTTAPVDAAATVSGNVIENSALKITVDGDGAISSFIDKKRGGAELAATIGDLKINDFAPKDESGTISVENSGPVSVTLRCNSTAGLDHTTWITVFRNSDRVDIRNRIGANFSNVRYWSFGFNLENPDVHTEEVGAVIRDKLKAQGGDYADTHARYDHVSVNHFADICDGANARGVTISNPDLCFAKLGNSTTTALDTLTPQINLLAGGQIDGPSLGIRGQNGNSSFLQRFSLQPHGTYNQTAAMKFSLEHQNPLVTGAINGVPNAPYAAAQFSLLTIDNPDVLLWALKPAEEGIARGLVARVWNMGETGGYGISLTDGLTSARRVTHIETDLEALPVASNQVKIAIAHAQLQSLRLMPAPMVVAPVVAPPK